MVNLTWKLLTAAAVSLATTKFVKVLRKRHTKRTHPRLSVVPRVVWCHSLSQNPRSETNNLNHQKSRRQSNWASTGSVALRDSKLKINNFSNLQRLVLASNQLKSLPPSLTQLVSLKVLILDANHLTQLPSDIGQLVRLQKLSVKNNALTTLPNTISHLQKLLLLDVSCNSLMELTHAVADCLQLEELNASKNNLEAIPVSLGQLQRLRMLNLNENKLSSIPSEVLTGCCALHTLLLHSNPITAQEFEGTEGFCELEQRRRSKYNKNIAARVLTFSIKSEFDEGIDRQLQ